MPNPSVLEYFDEESISTLYDCIGKCNDKLTIEDKHKLIKDILKKGMLSQYDVGFHFAVEKQRLPGCKSWQYLGRTIKPTRFVIPAGATVVFDESGLGVASEIIYSPEKYKSRLMRFRRSLR
jgi:hypothetical protein